MKTQKDRILIEMTALQKEYIRTAANKVTANPILKRPGSMREFSLPVLLEAASKALGLSFEDWLNQQEVSNERENE